jgi:hypothetical protein
MRELGIGLGVLAIVIGLMLLFAPRALVRVGEQTNIIYNIDGLIYRNRIVFGISLILASMFMAYSAV